MTIKDPEEIVNGEELLELIAEEEAFSEWEDRLAREKEFEGPEALRPRIVSHYIDIQGD
jgi:hypothetical protein